MVEYKHDLRTGTYYLMEINGRLWGSVQLAIDAGVDFPALLIATAGGAPVAPVTQYRAVTSRWLLGDVDHLIARFRHDARQLDLPSDAPGRLRCLVDFLTAFRPGVKNEVFRWSDPVPALRELQTWIVDVAGIQRARYVSEAQRPDSRCGIDHQTDHLGQE